MKIVVQQTLLLKLEGSAVTVLTKWFV